MADENTDRQDKKEVKTGKDEQKNPADKDELEGKNGKPQDEGRDEDGFQNGPSFLQVALPLPPPVKAGEVKNNGPDGKNERKEVHVPGKRKKGSVNFFRKGAPKPISTEEGPKSSCEVP